MSNNHSSSQHMSLKICKQKVKLSFQSQKFNFMYVYGAMQTMKIQNFRKNISLLQTPD